PWVYHTELTTPPEPFEPKIDWKAGFAAAMRTFTESILEPQLRASWERVQEAVSFSSDPGRAALLRCAVPCWTGEATEISGASLLAELRRESDLESVIVDRIADLLATTAGAHP